MATNKTKQTEKEIEETVKAVKVTKTEKQNDETLDILKALMEQVNVLKDELKNTKDELSNAKAELNQAKMDAVAERMTSKASSSQLDEEVTIIFNVPNSTLRATFPTWNLYLTEFGQKYTVTRRQFQELVNNKRSYFQKEYILLDTPFLELAKEQRVGVYNPGSKKIMHPEDIEKIAKMSTREIEDYYDNLSPAMQKSFASYFLGRCYEKDRDFFTVEKMNTVNKLIGGRLFDNLISVCTNEQFDTNR